jgi:sugar transferase (PEP-CTERM system associated)
MAAHRPSAVGLVVFQIFNRYVSYKAVLLVALEGILILLAILLGIKLRFWNNPEAFRIYTELPDFAVQALTVVLCLQICFYYNELYDTNGTWHPSEHLIRLGQAMGAACLLLGLLYFLIPSLVIGRGVFLIALGLAAASVTGARLVVNLAWRRTIPPESVIIFGTGKLASDVAREIHRRDDLNIRVLGFIETNQENTPAAADLFGWPVLGKVDRLEQIVETEPVGRIIVALHDLRGALPVRELLRLRTRGIRVEEAYSTLAALTGRIALENVRPSWLIFSGGFRRTPFTVFLKRIIDLSLSIVGGVLSIPLVALASAAILLDDGRPVFYRQRRVGLRGSTFVLTKLRTMRVNAEIDGAQWAEDNDPRITRVGRYLRRYRIDELPQFLNVIRGEMSFSGPRPERPEFVEMLRRKIPYYDERHSVRPGITGWAQVNYPYGATVEDAFCKLEYDLFYLKNMSIVFDFAVVFETVKIVLFGRGAR